MRHIKRYDDMIQAIRASTVQKTLKIRILNKKFLQNENFFSFPFKCFDFKLVDSCWTFSTELSDTFRGCFVYGKEQES